jgi:predicted transposase YbfD/YdcC
MEERRPVAILDYFEEIEDPRQRMKVLYPLEELLLLSLCGAIAGCEDFTDITLYGEEKLDFLRTLLPFEHGIPSHDALNDLFRDLDPMAFGKAFTAWAASLAGHVPGLVAIDGKTLRGSRDGAKGPLHLVSAWAGEQRLSLAQVATAEKSNEITAIPELLDLLVLKGAIVTIDAMGCQKTIAAAIREKEADYVLALKGNHGDLHDDVRTFFASDEGRALPIHETADADHGRLETRLYRMSDDIGWLIERNPGWEGLKSIGMVESIIEEKGKTSKQIRFYLASLPASLKIFAGAVRGHWGIENSLHWVLDVTFHEDLCRIRKDHAPQNFALIKRAAINLINKSRGKRSIKGTRKQAGWNNAALLNILAA